MKLAIFFVRGSFREFLGPVEGLPLWCPLGEPANESKLRRVKDDECLMQ